MSYLKTFICELIWFVKEKLHNNYCIFNEFLINYTQIVIFK